jgi:hypothetical protein
VIKTDTKRDPKNIHATFSFNPWQWHYSWIAQARTPTKHELHIFVLAGEKQKANYIVVCELSSTLFSLVMQKKTADGANAGIYPLLSNEWYLSAFISSSNESKMREEEKASRLRAGTKRKAPQFGKDRAPLLQGGSSQLSVSAPKRQACTPATLATLPDTLSPIANSLASIRPVVASTSLLNDVNSCITQDEDDKIAENLILRIQLLEARKQVIAQKLTQSHPISTGQQVLPPFNPLPAVSALASSLAPLPKSDYLLPNSYPPAAAPAETKQEAGGESHYLLPTPWPSSYPPVATPAETKQEAGGESHYLLPTPWPSSYPPAAMSMPPISRSCARYANLKLEEVC